MKGKKHSPAPSAATQTVGLPSKARPPSGPIPLIPDYHLIKVIGRGTFGTVWLAEETMAGVFRAIKVLDPPAKPQDAVRGDGGRPPRIDRELDGIHAYQVHAKDHPHLVSILKTGQCTLEEAPDQRRDRQGAQQSQPHNASGTGAKINATPAGHGPARQRRTVYYVMEIADHTGGAQPHHTTDYEPLTLATLLRQKHRLPITHAAPATRSSQRAGFPSPQRAGFLSLQRAGPSSAPVPAQASDLATAHLPNGSVIDHALALLDAIEHLYKVGLHHRDVKPSNCLFVGGVLKLADVGLTTSDNREQIGTPAYMPPKPTSLDHTGPRPTDCDPLDSDPTDCDPWASPAGANTPSAPDHPRTSDIGPPSDLYALGKTIYQMTTGLPAADYPDWPADLDPTSDPRLPELRKLINELCHPQAEKRLSSNRVARRRLAALASQPSAPAPSHRRVAVLLVVCAVCVLVGGLGMKWWYDRADPTRWQLGRAPYDGTEIAQEVVYEGRTWSLSRHNAPHGVYRLPTSQTNASFFDIQTGLLDGNLLVAGAFQLYNREKPAGNPITGDITVNDGEIDDLWLIVGEGRDAEMILLYYGEPGREPGVRCRFRRGVRLSEIKATMYEPLPIYLALSFSISPTVARDQYHEGEIMAFAKYRIATLTYISASDSTPTSQPNTSDAAP